jgi:hypothetical protein
MSEATPSLVEVRMPSPTPIEELIDKIDAISIPDTDIDLLATVATPIVGKLIDYSEGEVVLQNLTQGDEITTKNLKKELEKKILLIGSKMQVELLAWLGDMGTTVQGASQDLESFLQKAVPGLPKEQGLKISQGAMAIFAAPNLSSLFSATEAGDKNQQTKKLLVAGALIAVTLLGGYAWMKRNRQDSAFGDEGVQEFFPETTETIRKAQQRSGGQKNWKDSLKKINSTALKRSLILAAAITLVVGGILTLPKTSLGVEWGIAPETIRQAASYEDAIQGTELESLFGPEGLIEDEKSGLTVFQFGNAGYIDVTNPWDIDMIRFGAIDPNFIFFEEQRGWLEEKAGGQLPDSLFGSQTPQEREQAYLQWLNIGRQRGFYSEAEYQVLKYRLNLPREIWYQAMWLSKETGDDDDVKLKAFNQEVNRLLTMLKQKGWDSTED